MAELNGQKEKGGELKTNILNFSHIRFYLITLFILNLFSWLFSLWFFNKVSQNLIVLHYNVDFGVDLIGDVKNAFIIPALGSFAVVFNFILSLVFFKDKNFKFISHLLSAAAVLVNLILLLSLGSIYLINFR